MRVCTGATGKRTTLESQQVEGARLGSELESDGAMVAN
jgi:hypothetical protein